MIPYTFRTRYLAGSRFATIAYPVTAKREYRHQRKVEKQEDQTATDTKAPRKVEEEEKKKELWLTWLKKLKLGPYYIKHVTKWSFVFIAYLPRPRNAAVHLYI